MQDAAVESPTNPEGGNSISLSLSDGNSLSLDEGDNSISLSISINGHGKQNSKVALNFHWKSTRKQIRIEGNVSKISDKEANKYFNTRHKFSKIGAWASKQSSTLNDRNELLNRFP